MATPVPVGILPSIGHSYTVFAREWVMDELAHASRQDPLSARCGRTQGHGSCLISLPNAQVGAAQGDRTGS